MKTCRICKETKEKIKFYKNSHSPDGHREICAPCGAKEMAKYRDINYSLVYANKFKTTVQHMEELLQIKECQICGGNNGTRRLAVDHCHRTKKIRGMLCDFCNQGLGRFKDNSELLQNAINYIKEHND